MGRGDLASLRALDLSNNGLTSVSSQLLAWTSLASVDLSGNPWSCDCDLGFLREVIRAAVNKSEASVRVVRCWSPPSLRDRDVTSLDLDCDLQHSPSVSGARGHNTEIIVISVSSVAILLLGVTILLIHTRKVITRWFKPRCVEGDRGSLGSGRILQYEAYQDPEYVQHQSLAPPSLDQHEHHQSLVRNEHYFATLAKQERLINQSHFRPLGHTIKNSPVKTCEDWIYWREPNTDTLLTRSEHPMTEI